MTTIVFSKDRAMQLEAFLRSYKRHVAPLRGIFILYAASSEYHEKAYREVFDAYQFAVPVLQSDSFKMDVLRLVPVEGNVVFFVDDQVFIRPWIVVEESGLSLRHGLHLTRNYNSNDAPQAIPPYETLDDGRISWRWADGEMAWGYPLSLDGHVYHAGEMRAMIEAIEFRSPNTLESELQQFAPSFMQRQATCYRQSKVVNVPWNTVQTDWVNRYAGLSSGEMLEHWEAGKRIALWGIDGVLNESVHQEFPLMLEAR